jgi:hypothetical protein
MTALPELETMLYEAAQRREYLPRWRRRSRRLPRRRAGLLAFAAVLAGGTALAATTPWDPQVGDNHRGHPTIAQTAIPADQLAALGVLRRAQTDADRGPRVQAALMDLPADEFAGVHLDSARLLQSWDGGASILLAAQHTGQAGSVPPGQPDNAVCLIISSDYVMQGKNGVVKQVYAPSSGGTCQTIAGVKASGLLTGAEIDGRLQLNGVVPDGVAHVEVTLRNGETIRAPVSNNAFRIDATVPHGSYEDAPINWFDRDGNPTAKSR